jgi:hypothetical protein
MVETTDTEPKVTMTLAVSNPSSVPSALANTYIQGKSKVTATITASGKYGATISSYSLNVGGASKKATTNVITSDAITASSSVSVKGEAVDSRGFTGEAKQTISVTEYSKPLVIPLGSENAILCYRSDGNGNRVGNSSSVWIKAKRSYYNLEGKNGCSLQWRWKRSAEVWDDNTHKWADLIPKTTTNTNEYDAIVMEDDAPAEFILTQAYSIQIRAIDDLGEFDVKDFEIPTQDVALHLGKGGKNVSIGEYCDYSEEYTFKSAWKAIFENGIYTNHIASIDKYDGKDFNDLFKNTGYYTGESRPNAVGCQNYPINETGVLEVISAMRINETTGNPWGFAYQTYRDYTGAIYTRSYYSSAGWTEWKTIT